MNIVDALATDTAAHSFVELSLSPFFQRRWPSLYEAFQDARIDRAALQRAFAAQVPEPLPGHRLVIGADASSIARPQAPTAKDRTYVHIPNLPKECRPTTPGWQFSTLSVLPEQTSSWTYVLDNRRIESDRTQGQVAAQQLREVLSYLPVRPLFEGDSYYSGLPFLSETAGLACDKLVRMPKNRVLYRCAPPRTGKRGAPRKDGDPFRCKDAATHGQPDGHWHGNDASGHKVEVDCWSHLHFRKGREIDVTAIRVIRHGAQDTKRDPGTSWFLFTGDELPPLEQIPVLYGRRYSLEHAYRVDKQDLFWASVHLRTPEQMQSWTDILACVRDLLCLARDFADVRQPWESKRRPATPQQVRRALGPIIERLGTPARLPQVRGKSPGRRLGALVKKALRFPVTYKAADRAAPLV